MSMPADQTSTNEKSGKLLILAVLVIGLVGAAASWWFRYAATHRAAEFWGPQTATLIRDAGHVTLRSDASDDEPQDISAAPGLTHLRTALLEDSSYDWTSTQAPDTDWSHSFVFAAAEGDEPRAVVLFSPEFDWAANGSSGDPAAHAVATTSEFAAGLKKFFAEQPPAAAAE